MPTMLVQDVGEFQLIKILSDTVTRGNSDLIQSLNKEGFRLRVGIGDDAAAWTSPNRTQVLTTDTLVEGIHFQLNSTTWRDLGWKALTVNVSDIAAMGCRPVWAIVTLGLQPDLPHKGLVEMYEGIAEACAHYGSVIVGGDIVRSPTFFISIAVYGCATDKNGRLLERSGASVGDLIAVTGHLGCSAAGLMMATGKKRFNIDCSEHFKATHNRPMARLSEATVLADHGGRCAMDVSDGLFDALEKICESSQVGAVLWANDIPADKYLKQAMPDDWPNIALSGGEDYELLFTAPKDLYDIVASKFETAVTKVGQIVEGPPVIKVLDSNGNAIPNRKGWDHFHKN